MVAIPAVGVGIDGGNDKFALAALHRRDTHERFFDNLARNARRLSGRRAGSVAAVVNPNRVSAGAAQLDDRQVPSSGVKTDVQRQPSAGFASHQCPRLGTGRPPRPTGARLKARATVGRKVAGVALVRRPAAEPGVRAALVVPVRGGGQLAQECFASIRHEQ